MKAADIDEDGDLDILVAYEWGCTEDTPGATISSCFGAQNNAMFVNDGSGGLTKVIASAFVTGENLHVS